MNFLLTPNKEKVEKNAGVPCSYCNKVFSNPQALGGHLRAHQDEIKLRRGSNYPRRFRNSVSITNNTPQPLIMSHPRHFSGASGSNPSTLFRQVTSPFRFYSNENRWVNVSNFSANCMRNATTQFSMPLEFSSGSGHAEVQNSEPLSSPASAPSSSIVPTSAPLDPSLCLVSNGVCQFNTDQFRFFRDGVPSFSGNALSNFQDHNCGKFPYLVNTVTDLDPGLSSNQSPSLKEPNKHPSRSPGQGEGGKKRCLGEAGGSAELKRPKVNSKYTMETDKPSKKELLLFKDVENSSGSGISSNAEEEEQTDLDLSLHL